MILSAILTRTEQLSLNGRAVLRDLVNGKVEKLCFHLRGFCRALIH
jgi:hypothetical protein